MRLGQEGTARQYDVVGARVLAEVLLARPTRGGMASVSIRADSADWGNRTIGSWQIEHACLTCRNLTELPFEIAL